ncbi:MAG: polysaccharide biosynthesis C-terminal domain-containing protein [Sedimentisphaeraceae bacterium JB056]
MSSGVKDLGFSFGAKILTIVLSLASQSCLAWTLGPAGRGSYAVCLIFTTLLTLIFILGCDVANVYLVASKRMTISEGVVMTFIYSCTGSFLAIVTGLYLLRLDWVFFSKANHNDFVLALSGIPMVVLAGSIIKLMTAVGRFKWFAILQTFNGIIQLIFMFLLILVLRMGVTGAILSNIISCAFSVILALIYLRKEFGIVWVNPSKSHTIEMLHFGSRYYFGKLSNEVNFQVGAILLAFFAIKEDIGLFSLAAMITTRIMVIPDSLVTVLMSRVAPDEKGRYQLVAKCARLTFLVCGLLLLGIFVAAPLMIRVLFSNEFLPAVPLVRILVLGVLFRATSKVFVPYLLGTNKPGTVSISVAIGAVINLMLLWILFPIMGVKGASVGMATSYVISSTLLLVAFCRRNSCRIIELFRYKKTDFTEIYNIRKKI